MSSDSELSCQHSLDSEPRTVIIDAEGDVILFPENKTKLKVAYKMLCVASVPFAKMFSPQFAEGQSLSFESPSVISLPDDSVEAMELLCKCLYQKVTEEDLNAVSQPQKTEPEEEGKDEDRDEDEWMNKFENKLKQKIAQNMADAALRVARLVDKYDIK